MIWDIENIKNKHILHLIFLIKIFFIRFFFIRNFFIRIFSIRIGRNLNVVCNLLRHLFFFKKIRSSRPDMFSEKVVLRNFAKFTGKHLFQSLFFNKVAGAPAILLKKRLWQMCFPMNFKKFLRTPFFTEHLWWLLLEYIYILLKVLEDSKFYLF